MAITPPTRTAGSLGTTKNNANPVTNEPQQLTAPQYNVCADNLIDVIDQSNANESLIFGGGLSGYGSWTYDNTSNTGAGIASGAIRFSGADPTSAGLMYIHKTNAQGFNFSTLLDKLEGWKIILTSGDGTELVTALGGAGGDGGTYWVLPISSQTGSTALTNGFAFTISLAAPAIFPGGAGGGTYDLGDWFWTGASGASDPGTGNLKFTSGSPGFTSAIYISVINNGTGVDFIETFQDLQPGDFILLRTDTESYAVRYQITAQPIDNGTWFNIPVIPQSSGGGIGSSAPMRVVLIKSSAGAAALGSNVLWQWNGVDLTQFAAAGSPSFATAGWTANFDVQNAENSQSGKLIRVAGTAGAGDGALIYLANDPLPSLGLGAYGGNKYNYKFEFDCLTDNAVTKNVGICIFASEESASFRGYTRSFRGGVMGRIDNGTLWVQGGGSGGFSLTDSQLVWQIEGRDGDATDPDGDFPHWKLIIQEAVRGANTMKQQVTRNTFGALDGNVNVTTPVAQFAGRTCNRWGLYIGSDVGGGPPTTDWEINDIRIVKS